MKFNQNSLKLTRSLFLLAYMLVALALQSIPQAMETAHTSEKHSLFDNEEIVQKQHEMIKDKNLTVWGIGLFAGSDITSGMIRKLTNSSWSHVALVLTDQEKRLYCFESTGSYDEIMHKGMLPQVQISPWLEALANYSGVVAHRQLEFSQIRQNTPKNVNKLVYDLIGKPYEENLTSLIEALSGSSKKPDVSSLFCSELVAEVLQELGFLDEEIICDNYLPKDFSTEIPLHLEGAKLSNEVILKGQLLDKGECFGSCCTGCVIL